MGWDQVSRRTGRLDIPLRLLSRERDALLRLIILSTPNMAEGLPAAAMTELKRALLGESYDNSGLYVTPEEGRWLSDFLVARLAAAEKSGHDSDRSVHLRSGIAYLVKKIDGVCGKTVESK